MLFVLLFVPVPLDLLFLSVFVIMIMFQLYKFINALFYKEHSWTSVVKYLNTTRKEIQYIVICSYTDMWRTSTSQMLFFAFLKFCSNITTALFYFSHFSEMKIKWNMHACEEWCSFAKLHRVWTVAEGIFLCVLYNNISKSKKIFKYFYGYSEELSCHFFNFLTLKNSYIDAGVRARTHTQICMHIYTPSYVHTSKGTVA